MKLQHLPLGARFEYEGVVYVKTGPLTATAEQGGQRVIPRYAVLKPLDVAVPEPAASGRGQLSRTAVLAAFEDFYTASRALVGEAGETALAEARAAFLARMK